MGSDEGDIGRGRVARGREAGRSVDVEGDKGGGIDGGGEGIATGVVEGGVPAITMGVKIAQNDCVLPVESLEERVDVEAEVRRAGGRRRNVDVDDGRRFVVDDDGMSEEFDAGVRRVEVAEVDGSEAEGVMDERGKAAAFVTLSISSKDGEIGDFGIRRRRLKFAFLETSDDDIVHR